MSDSNITMAYSLQIPLLLFPPPLPLRRLFGLFLIFNLFTRNDYKRCRFNFNQTFVDGWISVLFDKCICIHAQGKRARLVFVFIS